MPAAVRRGMMRYVAWSSIGATIAVLLGRWCELFQLGQSEAWFAAAVGAVLGVVAYQGPVPPSILSRTNGGALSLTGSRKSTSSSR
jgi:hypothetical protein